MPKERAEWRPRLSVEVSPEVFEEMQKLIPWGMRRQIFSVILEHTLKLIKTHGPGVLAILMSGELRFEEMLRVRLPKNDDDK